MDKITRMLILYSSLMNGEEINKTIFCFQNDCSPRSFDRDIEDIRLFLSESFSVLEVNYNRASNTYYIKGAKRQQLEVMEYLFMERILQDVAVLRNDELDVLKSHLLSNTGDIQKLLSSHKICETYQSPEHNKALLKIHGDLELTIRNQKQIRMIYYDEAGKRTECEVTPCCIKYKQGKLYFVGYCQNDSDITAIKLEQVHSFEVLRQQTIPERKKVELYLADYAKADLSDKNSDLIEMELECAEDDYAVLCTVFTIIEVMQPKEGLLKLKIITNEEAFTTWYLSHLCSSVTIVQPLYMKDKLVAQAKILLRKYGGRD